MFLCPGYFGVSWAILASLERFRGYWRGLIFVWLDTERQVRICIVSTLQGQIGSIWRENAQKTGDVL